MIGRHRLQFHLEWKGMECLLRIKGASERVRERMGGLTCKNGLSLSRAG
jgi:hypothetical protein